MRSGTARRASFAALVGLLGLVLPAAVVAHPLGNFTINHFAGLRVTAGSISLDVVVDFAEIPAFQERIRIDADGDGDVSDEEADAARAGECATLVPDLHLTLAQVRLKLILEQAGLEFPAGAGGVPTMRVVCEFAAPSSAPLSGGQTIAYADTSFADRIGWHEVVVLGDGVTIGRAGTAPAPADHDISGRLTAYPKDLLTKPLDVRSASFTASRGGARLGPFQAPDAAPLPGAGPVATPLASPTSGSAATASAAPASSRPAAVPGGVGADIPDVFGVSDLTPFLALVSIVLAAALGAGHALTPGHGKTLMAAYLVGTRGTIRHAAGLGLAVTISHTFGILALALLVTGAESLLPPDVVVRTIPVVAALAFVAIGASMLFTEVTRRYPGAGRAGAHDHGGISQGHVPVDERALGWKRLVALGLAGGIIPSTSALIILLGTIVAGRAAFGVVLVVAFGLGMAVVLAGVGGLLVVARDRMARLGPTSALGRVARQAPLIASVAVLGIGLWLTAQALAGTAVL